MSLKRALFIHGAGGGGWEWGIWSRVFAARGFAVVAEDLQPAPAGVAATTLGDYRARIVEKARCRDAGESLPDDALVLIGASLGGLLALMLADELRPAALVLVNPMPPAPWHLELPAREPYPSLVPWSREATLTGTRRALPDADAAACAFAWRRWRDESGAVLNAARAGVEIVVPTCPVLVLASALDEDTPVSVSEKLAGRLGASLLRVDGASHVGPLLGRSAAMCAQHAIQWLSLA